MAKRPWVKLWRKILGDSMVSFLIERKGHDCLTVIIALLTSADDETGELEIDLETMAYLCKVSEERLQEILGLLQEDRFQFIEPIEDGRTAIVHWIEYQAADSAERTRVYREKKRHCDVTEPSQARHRDVTVTSREVECDADVTPQGEGEGEGDIRLTSSDASGAEVVDNSGREEPDPVPERLAPFEDTMRATFKRGLRREELSLIEELLKSHYPSKIQRALREASGRDPPPGEPVKYVHSFLREFQTRKSSEEAEGPLVINGVSIVDRRCPVCEAKIAGTSGLCMRCGWTDGEDLSDPENIEYHKRRLERGA